MSAAEASCMAGMLEEPPTVLTSLLIRHSSAVQRLMSSLRLTVGFSPATSHHACWMQRRTSTSKLPSGTMNGQGHLMLAKVAGFTAVVERGTCAQLWPHDCIQQLESRVEFVHLHTVPQSTRSLHRRDS